MDSIRVLPARKTKSGVRPQDMQCHNPVASAVVRLLCKEALDVPMLSARVIYDLVEGLSIQNVSEFLKIENRREMAIEVLKAHYGRRAVALRFFIRMCDALRLCRVTTFDRFLVGLGIEQLNRTSARNIALHCNTIHDLKMELIACKTAKDQTGSWLRQIYAQKEINALRKALNDKQVLQHISDLLEEGDIVWGETITKNGRRPWEGVVFYYVNPNRDIPFAEVRAKVMAMGGRLSNIFSQSVDVVLYDDIQSLEELGLNPNADIEYWSAVEPLEATLHHFS